MEKEYYDVQDVINAECNLEPLKCRYCGDMEEVSFVQYASDAHCAKCGKWQLGDADKEKPISGEVEVIASGYEWICSDPDCNKFNTEIEITEHVVCSKCGKKYTVDDYHHAHS